MIVVGAIYVARIANVNSDQKILAKISTTHPQVSNVIGHLSYLLTQH